MVVLWMLLQVMSDSDSLPGLHRSQVQDMVWVDLDKGTVRGDLADGQSLPSIPQEAAKGFLERYGLGTHSQPLVRAWCSLCNR